MRKEKKSKARKRIESRGRGKRWAPTGGSPCAQLGRGIYDFRLEAEDRGLCLALRTQHTIAPWELLAKGEWGRAAPCLVGAGKEHGVTGGKGRARPTHV